MEEAPASRSRATARAVIVALVGTSLALAAGYVLKRQCNPPQSWANGFHYTHNCYTDILPLYRDRKPPFNEPGRDVPFSQGGRAYVDNNFEYPAFTGLFVDAVNSFVPRGDGAGFVRANAWGLSAFALAGAAALARVAADRRRLVILFVSPTLVSYAFHNWDLLAVSFTAISIWAFGTRRDGAAGAALGLGAAAKLMPAVLLPAFLLARRRERAALMPLIAGAIAGFAAPNLVVLLSAGLEGWWFPFSFHSERPPNIETWWWFGARHAGVDAESASYARFASIASTLAFAAGAALVLWRESLRERVRPVTMAFALVLVLLLTAKVFSPQYSLWLLPFFVLLRLPWWSVVAYAIADMVELSAIWGLGVNIRGPNAEWWFDFTEIAVLVRYAMLGVLLVLALRRDREGLRSTPASALDRGNAQRIPETEALGERERGFS